MAIDQATIEAHHPPADKPRHARVHGVKTVAVMGEVLIAVGLLVGLYVVWELFYTDVLAGREQQQVLEELAWGENVGPISANGAGGEPGVAVPDVVPLIPAELQYRDQAPEAMARPGYAETFGALYVPRWGADYARPISEGVTRRDVLDTLGIGHYPDTAMPGGLGNFAVAGHRTTYNKPFSDVDQLETGDALVVQTDDAWFVYRVTDWLIVKPTDVEVIAPVPGQPHASPDGRYITLTTCHPKFSAAQRWIVHGELEYWAPAGHGYPPEVVEVPT